MGLFSNNADRKTERDWVAEAKEANALLEQLAKEAEAIALQRRPEMLAAVLSEHKRQSGGFAFECRRFGDFLSIFVDRLGNPDRPEYASARYTSRMPERKFSTTLNIGKTREFKLTVGNPADENGELSYGYSIAYDGGHTLGGTSFGMYLPEKGHYEVKPNYPHIPYDRPSFYLDPPPVQQPGGMMMSGGESYSIKLRTPNYPRAARDDKIRFEGIGATIFVPAGRGQEVHDAILAEIARSGPQ